MDLNALFVPPCYWYYFSFIYSLRKILFAFTKLLLYHESRDSSQNNKKQINPCVNHCKKHLHTEILMKEAAALRGLINSQRIIRVRHTTVSCGQKRR